MMIEGNGMTKYILSRLVALVLTLFIVLTIAFMVLRLMPGNVFENPELPIAVIEALKDKLRLNDPLIVQYGSFLEGILFKNDWGTSVSLEPSVPAFTVLLRRIPLSLQINFISLLAALPVGIMLGIIAALKQNKLPDYIISFLVVLWISVPSFIYASLLQYGLASRLGWFPIVYQPSGPWVERFRSLLLPMIALSFWPIATVTRYLRGELIETINSEFMLLARTKGLNKFQATVRHAFRNSFLPLTNIVIPMFTFVLGGSLVVEKIFSIPGVGGLMIDSINSRDYPVAIAVLIFYSAISLLTILLVDLSYAVIDPRVRLGGGKQ